MFSIYFVQDILKILSCKVATDLLTVITNDFFVTLLL